MKNKKIKKLTYSSFFNFKKIKSKNAQVAIEFLLVISIILFLATFVLYDIFNKRGQIADTSEFLLKKSMCLEISSFISGVYTKGSGTEAYLKVKGDQFSYTLTIQPGARNIYVGDKKAAYCTIPISSVSNSRVNCIFFCRISPVSSWRLTILFIQENGDEMIEK